MESKYWNLKVKGIDTLNYNHRFQELARMCDRMFHKESAKMERYIGGLPDMIHGSCTNCKKIGHLAYDCKGRPAAANNNNNNQKAQGATARGITCYECKVLGYYKSDCPKLKNGNQGNQHGNGNAVARAYAIGTVRTNPN
nr:reverse transcriptase domain-containing protein [Tanacetum cinerariifolium]